MSELNCPECGGAVDERRNQLTDQEFTTVLDCRECDWVIETESNLVGREEPTDE